MQHSRRICLILAILWMALIFMFSSRPADLSTQDSNFVSLAILHVTVPDFETLPAEEQKAFVQAMEYPVRKAAHMMEYAILAMLLAGAFRPAARTGVSGKTVISDRSAASRKAGLSILVSMLYACTDEFHQHFVPGRSCEVRDVLIDTVGAMIGVLILGTFMHFHNQRHIKGL